VPAPGREKRARIDAIQLAMILGGVRLLREQHAVIDEYRGPERTPSGEPAPDRSPAASPRGPEVLPGAR
jgi:hypothetical protein